ncbi:MAG TPA: ATP cone domain-containing protein [Candidatus Hydrogenedens sp.]|nr:ATP cone domain-containing protein [Candidatus Hydrogenedens sp.]
MKAPKKQNKCDLLFDLFGFPSIPLQGALRVKKRDGHIESFSLQKLSESIKKALQSGEMTENELEYSLATAIKTYLRECHGLEAIVSTEEIYSLTTQALQEMGLKKALKMYTEYGRQKHLQQKFASQAKETFIHSSRKKKIHDKTTNFTPLINQKIEEVHKEIEQILNPLNLNITMYEKVSQHILTILDQLQIHSPSKEFLNELCYHILKKEGIIYNYKSKYLNLPIDECVEILIHGIDEEGTPDKTDVHLGEKVKEQISRVHIFSAECIDAHEEGIIYLHALDKPDRFMNLELPTYLIWALRRKENKAVKSPGDFWNALKEIHLHCVDYFYGDIYWWGFNWIITPFIKGLEGTDYKDWLSSFIMSQEKHGDRTADMKVVLDWYLPKRWMDTYVLGHQGKNLGTTYSSYISVAQDLMVDILECIFSDKTRTNNNATTSLFWRFDLPMTIKPSSVFWSHLVSCVEDHSIPVSLQFVDYNKFDLQTELDTWSVTINLARIAYNNTTPDDFYSSVYSTLLLAIQACEEKMRFFVTSIEQSQQNIWKLLLNQILKNTSAPTTITAYPMVLNLCGIQEAIYLLTKKQSIMKPLELLQHAEVMLKKIKRMADGCIRGKSINIQIALEKNIYVLQRLARKDTDDCPELLSLFTHNQPFHFSPCYTDEITPLVFYHSEELIPQFSKLFSLSTYFDKSLTVTLSPQRVWDSLIIGEVIDLFAKENKEFIPVEFRFVPSE